jgi:pimeloyl-ACP methyl ester carboxylesterase
MSMPQTLDVTLTNGIIRLHYWPGGAQPLLALHGFANNGLAFALLAPLLQPYYTLYAPDLPFHGRSQWTKESYKPADIEAIAQFVLQHSGASSLSLMGHSLGARLVLSTALLSEMPLDTLFLLAPDGIAGAPSRLADHWPQKLRPHIIKLTNRWHRLPTRLVQLLPKRWLNTEARRILQYHWHNDRQRESLLNTWLSLAAFPISKTQVRRRRLPVKVMLAMDDRLMDNTAIARFFSRLDNCEIYWINCAHNMPAAADLWYRFCLPEPAITAAP